MLWLPGTSGTGQVLEAMGGRIYGSAWAPQDTFLSGSGLPGRTSTDGETWTQVSTFNGTAVIPASNGMIPTNNAFGCNTLGAAPPSANYTCECDITFVATPDQGEMGAAVRIDASTGANYMLHFNTYLSATKPFSVFYADGGGQTNPVLLGQQGTPNVILGHVYHLSLGVSGTGATVSLVVLVTDTTNGGTTVWSTTISDSASSRIVAAGKPGIWMHGPSPGFWTNGNNASYAKLSNWQAHL